MCILGLIGILSCVIDDFWVFFGIFWAFSGILGGFRGAWGFECEILGVLDGLRFVFPGVLVFGGIAFPLVLGLCGGNCAFGMFGVGFV